MAKKKESEIASLSRSIRSNNSYSRAFLKGLFAGLGSAIGATIVFALVIAFLASTINSIEDVPILNKIIPTTKIQQVLPDQVLPR